MRRLKLNIRQGNLPTWAEQEAKRLSQMSVFQREPVGYAKTARVRALNAIRKQLGDAGITGLWQTQVIHDILALVRLLVNAE
jgi:hypothetical protein